MKRMKRVASKVALIALGGWLLILFTCLPALAESVIPGTAAVDSHVRTIKLFHDDQVLTGSSSKYDAFFEIGKGQETDEGSYLDLQFDHSTTLIARLSILNISIDDLPLTAISLDDTNAKKKSVHIDLSGSRLGAGYHKLTLTAHMRQTEQLCENPASEGLWLVVYKSSMAAFSLKPAYQKADLSWYPSPFLERGDDPPLHALLVVPDGMDQADFGAAVRFSQFFTEQTGDHQLMIPIYTESDVTDAMLLENNTIWIGESSQWKLSGRKVEEAAASLPGYTSGTEGYIAEVDSPWNSSRTALILSGNPQQMDYGANVLTNELLFRQLHDRYLNISTAQLQLPDRTDAFVPGQAYTLSLRQLGYDQLRTESVLQGNSGFQYSLPANWDWGDSVDLHIKYSHSDAIVYRKSVMTVKVNGVPVGSVPLTENSSKGATADFPVKSSVIGSSRTMSVVIGFQFANPSSNEPVNQGFGCSEDVLLGDWAVVDRDSSFTISPIERQTAYLQALPFPFVEEGQWNHTALLMNRVDSQELCLAMTLIGKMGAAVQGTTGLQYELTASDGWQERVRNKNIIYLGSAEEVPSQLNGFDGSYVQFGKLSIVSRSSEVQLLEPLKQDYSILQLTRSPLNPDNYLFMAVSAQPGRLDAIGQAWTDPEQSGKISTRISAINGFGEVFSFPGTENSLVESIHPDKDTSGRWDELRITMPVFAAILLLLVIFTVVAIIRNSRSKR